MLKSKIRNYVNEDMEVKEWEDLLKSAANSLATIKKNHMRVGSQSENNLSTDAATDNTENFLKITKDNVVVKENMRNLRLNKAPQHLMSSLNTKLTTSSSEFCKTTVGNLLPEGKATKSFVQLASTEVMPSLKTTEHTNKQDLAINITTNTHATPKMIKISSTKTSSLPHTNKFTYAEDEDLNIQTISSLKIEDIHQTQTTKLENEDDEEIITWLTTISINNKSNNNTKSRATEIPKILAKNIRTIREITSSNEVVITNTKREDLKSEDVQQESLKQTTISTPETSWSCNDVYAEEDLEDEHSVTWMTTKYLPNKSEAMLLSTNSKLFVTNSISSTPTLAEKTNTKITDDDNLTKTTLGLISSASNVVETESLPSRPTHGSTVATTKSIHSTLSASLEHNPTESSNDFTDVALTTEKLTAATQTTFNSNPKEVEVPPYLLKFTENSNTTEETPTLKTTEFTKTSRKKFYKFFPEENEDMSDTITWYQDKIHNNLSHYEYVSIRPGTEEPFLKDSEVESSTQSLYSKLNVSDFNNVTESYSVTEPSKFESTLAFSDSSKTHQLSTLIAVTDKTAKTDTLSLVISDSKEASTEDHTSEQSTLNNINKKVMKTTISEVTPETSTVSVASDKGLKTTLTVVFDVETEQTLIEGTSKTMAEVTTASFEITQPTSTTSLVTHEETESTSLTLSEIETITQHTTDFHSLNTLEEQTIETTTSEKSQTSLTSHTTYESTPFISDVTELTLDTSSMTTKTHTYSVNTVQEETSETVLNITFEDFSSSTHKPEEFVLLTLLGLETTLLPNFIENATESFTSTLTSSEFIQEEISKTHKTEDLLLITTLEESSLGSYDTTNFISSTSHDLETSTLQTFTNEAKEQTEESISLITHTHIVDSSKEESTKTVLFEDTTTSQELLSSTHKAEEFLLLTLFEQATTSMPSFGGSTSSSTSIPTSLKNIKEEFMSSTTFHKSSLDTHVTTSFISSTSPVFETLVSETNKTEQPTEELTLLSHETHAHTIDVSKEETLITVPFEELSSSTYKAEEFVLLTLFEQQTTSLKNFNEHTTESSASISTLVESYEEKTLKTTSSQVEPTMKSSESPDSTLSTLPELETSVLKTISNDVQKHTEVLTLTSLETPLPTEDIFKEETTITVSIEDSTTFQELPSVTYETTSSVPLTLLEFKTSELQTEEFISLETHAHTIDVSQTENFSQHTKSIITNDVQKYTEELPSTSLKTLTEGIFKEETSKTVPFEPTTTHKPEKMLLLTLFQSETTTLKPFTQHTFKSSELTSTKEVEESSSLTSSNENEFLPSTLEYGTTVSILFTTTEDLTTQSYFKEITGLSETQSHKLPNINEQKTTLVGDEVTKLIKTETAMMPNFTKQAKETINFEHSTELLHSSTKATVTSKPIIITHMITDELPLTLAEVQTTATQPYENKTQKSTVFEETTNLSIIVEKPTKPLSHTQSQNVPNNSPEETTLKLTKLSESTTIISHEPTRSPAPVLSTLSETEITPHFSKSFSEVHEATEFAPTEFSETEILKTTKETLKTTSLTHKSSSITHKDTSTLEISSTASFKSTADTLTENHTHKEEKQSSVSDVSELTEKTMHTKSVKENVYRATETSTTLPTQVTKKEPHKTSPIVTEGMTTASTELIKTELHSAETSGYSKHTLSNNTVEKTVTTVSSLTKTTVADKLTQIIPGLSNESTCNLTDYINQNACVCSIDNLVVDLREKLSQPETIDIENYYCPVLKHIDNGITLKNTSVPHVIRFISAAEFMRRRREVIQNYNIEKILGEPLELRYKAHDVFALPGMKMQIPCVYSPEIVENVVNYTWTFADNLLPSEERVQDRNGILTIDNVTPQDGGNYTCFVITSKGREESNIKYEHYLSIVSLPTYSLTTRFLYNSTELCQSEDTEILSLYFPSSLAAFICGSYFKVCKINVSEPQCISKLDNYLTLNLSIVIEPLNAIVPAINSSICDVNCEMAVYSRIVTFVLKNLETIEKMPVYINLSYRQEILFPVNEAYNQSEIISTAEPPRLIIGCPAGFGYYAKTHLCGACKKNTYSRKDETKCMPCPAGQYQPLAGSKSCMICSNPLQDPYCLRIVYSNTQKFRILVGATMIIIILLGILIIWCQCFKNSEMEDLQYKNKIKNRRRHRMSDIEKQEAQPLLNKDKNKRVPPEPPPPDFY